jgi:hypothetical protein
MRWHFFGRDAELELAGRVLARPGQSGILVRGAPGMGRSRFVVESLGRADGAGYALMPLLGSRDDHQSLSTLRLGIAQYVDDIEALALVRQGPERIATRLAELCGNRRVVMVMDDAHLMDDDSLCVAVELMRRCGAGAIITVPAYDSVPGRLRPLVAAGELLRLELRALSINDVRELVAHAVGTDIATESTVARLHRLSHGNPRLLRRLTSALDTVAADDLRSSGPILHRRSVPA